MAKRLLRRLRAEDGFGIIELTVAIVMLNVGILALVAAFNSGAVSLARSSKIANATVIADKILEQFRGYRNCQIYLDTSSGTSNSTYTSDTAITSDSFTGATHTIADELTSSNPASATTYSPIPVACGSTAFPAHQQTTDQGATVTAPDHRDYVVDVYVLPVKLQASAGYQKQVTVVIRDGSVSSTPQLVRESSTYDPFAAP